MSRSSPPRGKSAPSFRIGKVRANRRGRVWYLCYFENGKRCQPRVGPDREAARLLASQINAQLEAGAPSVLGFQPIAIAELRGRWLEQHEHVRRSSLQTIRRYRTATQHLVNFVTDVRPVARASDFGPRQAEDFIRYLRSLKVAPNGHRKARRRPLKDCGIKFILETSCTLFSYAQRHRHLSPYAENPFRTIEVGRIPIEDAKPVIALSDEQQVSLLRSSDEWQFPIFLTLLLTGLRPGELVHLLLPEDLDLDQCWLYVRNKTKLGWQIKTRTQRDVPLVPALAQVLSRVVGKRTTGPVFCQRGCGDGHEPPLSSCSAAKLELELSRRVGRWEKDSGDVADRAQQQTVAVTVWRDLGALASDKRHGFAGDRQQSLTNVEDLGGVLDESSKLASAGTFSAAAAAGLGIGGVNDKSLRAQLDSADSLRQLVQMGKRNRLVFG